jgi:hypothetical protein
MTAKPCDNCTIIMVNYVDLWIVHTQVTSQLKGAKSEIIIVIVSCVGMVFLLEGVTLNLSPDTWTVHVFPSWFSSHWFKW